MKPRVVSPVSKPGVTAPGKMSAASFFFFPPNRFTPYYHLLDPDDTGDDDDSSGDDVIVTDQYGQRSTLENTYIKSVTQRTNARPNESHTATSTPPTGLPQVATSIPTRRAQVATSIPTRRAQVPWASRFCWRELLPIHRLNGIWLDYVMLIIQVMSCVIYVTNTSVNDKYKLQCSSTSRDLRSRPDLDSCQRTGSPRETVITEWMWVQRGWWAWLVEVTLAFTFIGLTIVKSVAAKGERSGQRSWKTLWQLCLLLTAYGPLLASVVWPPQLKELFAPVFLASWVIKDTCRDLFATHNTTALSRRGFESRLVRVLQEAVVLMVMVLSLVFICTCLVHHAHSPSPPLTLYQTLSRVTTTFLTAGLAGDAPLFDRCIMIFFIFVALVTVPSQVEAVVRSYTDDVIHDVQQPSRKDRSVVVCGGNLTNDVIALFLREFSSKDKSSSVTFLCPNDLDPDANHVLNDPRWRHRVTSVTGSCLKDADLQLCRVDQSSACFILAAREAKNKQQADSQTVIRSWAVHEFAPRCQQFVQLFHSANRSHLDFLDNVVCHDDLIPALLAKACTCPALLSLVAQLVASQEPNQSQDELQPANELSRHIGLRHTKVERSQIFQRYEGYAFSEASADAYARHGVCLVAVVDKNSSPPRLVLNPGPSYNLQARDTCVYLSAGTDTADDEEQSRSAFYVSHPSADQSADQLADQSAGQPAGQSTGQSTGQPADQSAGQTAGQSAGQPAGQSTGQSTGQPAGQSAGQPTGQSTGQSTGQPAGVTKREEDHSGRRPEPTLSVSRVHSSRTNQKVARKMCCLYLDQKCQHTRESMTSHPRWERPAIVMATRRYTDGAWNLLCHLSRDPSMGPVVAIFSENPSDLDLGRLLILPMVFISVAAPESVTDLLKAEVKTVGHFIVYSDVTEHDVTIADLETISVIEMVRREFPQTCLVANLHRSFSLGLLRSFSLDNLSQTQQQGDATQHQGAATVNRNSSPVISLSNCQLFSSELVDQVLYQSYFRRHLLSFLRHLLDIGDTIGHLHCVVVTSEICLTNPRYGDLYRELSLTHGEIPFAIYRPAGLDNILEDRPLKTTDSNKSRDVLGTSSDELAELTGDKCHLSPKCQMSDKADQESTFSDIEELRQGQTTPTNVWLHPESNVQLRAGDIVFVIRTR